MSAKKNILTLLLVSISAFAMGQFSEVGFTAGTTYYIGDLNPTKHFYKHSHLGVGLVYKYNFNNRYVLNLTGLYGSLEGNDNLQDDPVLRERNLHFRATLWEASSTVEINFFEYRTGKDKKNFTPYIYLGLGYFRADPKTRIDDTWFSLQPLGTEGQGTTLTAEDNYKLDHVNLPFGAGLKTTVGRIDWSIHWGLRRTWTDYIDDVSGNYVDNDVLALENGPLAAALADRNLSGNHVPSDVSRGDAQTRDWYVYTGFTVTYIIGPRFLECYELNQRMK